MFSIRSVFCVLILNQIVFAEDSPFVKIQQGELKGRYLTSRSGRPISSFFGIPYAALPVGELRFKSPKPADGWRTTRDATKYGSPCVQKSMFGKDKNPALIIGDEDCLFLNVFTPKVRVDSYLPVMVFIHGGGWFCGSPEIFSGPEYLLDKDIVLVTINYRLGALGFLSTEDDIAPGNYGLKDQVAALRWVRDNIKYFGGNPDSVTIFGESAGSYSVSLHMLSPLSKGLFHGAICESGTALRRVVTVPPGVSKKYSKFVAEAVGCPVDSSNSLIKCLCNIPAAILANYTHEVSEPGVLHSTYMFRSRVEGKHEDAFLTENPIDQITSVPWIVGFNSEEGAMSVFVLKKDETGKSFRSMNKNFDKIMAKSIMLQEKEPSKDITKKIREFYFGEKEINKDVVKDLINVYTDQHYLYPTTESIRLHKGPVYYYYFNYYGKHSTLEDSNYMENDLGVSHGDELPYLFPLKTFIINHTLTDDELQVSRKMVELWTNFATYRTPTPKKSSTIWEPVTTSDMEYLHISNDGFVMKKNLLKQRFDFWKSLPLQEHLHYAQQSKIKQEKTEL